MEEKSKLVIKFNDFGDEEKFSEVLGTDIPVESIMRLLQAFYAYKVGVYINNNDYEGIKTLEGILELHNVIKGNTKNI